MKFKVGDRVYYSGDFTEELIGKTGTVKEIKGPDDILVNWDDPADCDGVLPENLGFLREAQPLTPEQQAFDATYKLTPMEIVSKYYEDQLAKDAVNHPDHYQGDKIECIEYLKDNMPFDAYLGYLEGNAKKYMHRWRRKGKPVEDLKKAIWYLNRLVTELDD